MRILIALSVVLLFSACSEQPKENQRTQTDIVSDSVFTGGIEGPCINLKNQILIVNLEKEGTVGIADIKDSLEFVNWITLPENSIGNSIQMNSKGDLFIADYAGHNVLKIEHGTKTIEYFAHSDLINQPNDIVLLTDSSGFVSDPNWSDSTGNLLFFKQGKITVIESDMGTTNGVCLSPDKKVLYVNESIQRNIWKYDLDGSRLLKKTLFHNFDDFGMDGMKCDEHGDLYVTRYGKGEVVIFDKSGALKNTIRLNGEKPTNIVQSRLDKDLFFVTLQDTKWVESFKR